MQHSQEINQEIFFQIIVLILFLNNFSFEIRYIDMMIKSYGYWIVTCCFALLTFTIISGPPTLQIQAINNFDWVYDDAGTGAADELSIWRPKNIPAGYHALGFVGMGCHCAPKNTFVVKELVAGTLAAPIRFDQVWQDHKSGGNNDVTLWRPIPPAGYVCLGDVAIRSYSGTPDKDWIRCIKNSETTTGKAKYVWNDRKSGASRDVGVWQAQPINMYGLMAGLFVSRDSHDVGDLKFYMLSKFSIKGMQHLNTILHDDYYLLKAKDYAPNIYLHQSEIFYPGNAQTFFDKFPTKTKDGAVFKQVPISCPGCYNSNMFGQNPKTNRPPMYAMIVRKTTEGIVDVNYWHFYPYNRGKDINVKIVLSVLRGTFGNHVGDWQHISIRFNRGYPYQIYLSQHDSGEFFYFGDKNLALNTKYQGNNLIITPVAYSAKGSHGIYSSIGSFNYKSINLGVTKVRLYDQTGSGSLWNGRITTKPFMRQQRGKYTGDLSFLNFSGRWGNQEWSCPKIVGKSLGFCQLEDGPTGPMDKGASSTTSLDF